MVRRRLLVALGLVIVGAGIWVVLGPLRTWRSIERVPFDPPSARQSLEAVRAADPAGGSFTEAGPDALSPPPTTASTTTTMPADEAPPTTTPAPEAPAPSPAIADSEYEVYLILGSDAKPTEDPTRADTIMLYVIPEGRGRSMLVSIPRGLYVINPCSGEGSAINTNLEGCGEVGGLDLMGVAVEDYTGLPVDHLVLFDLAGFQAIIDQIGGVEVCVERAVKLGTGQRTFLEPGCSTLNGRGALRWVRSRKTLELVDGTWQLMEGAGDRQRTDRQRDIVRQVLAHADEFDSPGDLLALVSELSDSFALDEGFGLGEAIDLAWDLRGVVRRPMVDLTLGATGAVSPAGDFVLIPDKPFSEYLKDAFG